MSDPLPIVLVPGLNCSARLYAEQIPALWRFGPVFVADHTRDDTISAIARRILAAAPPRFALAGLSMGGYISFEIVRQAAERVAKLALLDTGARAESPEQTQMRRPRIELARAGHVAEVSDSLFPILVHPNRHNDETLKRLMRTMAEEVGAEAFLRQQQAIMARPDSRSGLSAITCPTLVLVGDGAGVVAGNSGSDSGGAARCRSRLRAYVDARTAAGRGRGVGRLDAVVTGMVLHDIGPRPDRRNPAHRSHGLRPRSVPAVPET